MASKRGRKKGVSENQKEALVSYLELNLWVARNQFTSSDGTGNRDEQWITLANMLNALGGACKSPLEWKKCWADQRNAIRKKYMAEKSRMERSGVNGAVVDRLDTYEQRVVAIVTKEAIEGDGTREHGLLGVPVPSTTTTAAPEVDINEEQVSPEVECFEDNIFDPDINWQLPRPSSGPNDSGPSISDNRQPQIRVPCVYSGPNVPESNISGNRQSQRPVPREYSGSNASEASSSRNRQLERPTHHSGQANQRRGTGGYNHRWQTRGRQQAQPAQRARDEEGEMFRTLLDLKRRKLDILEEGNNREKEERDMKREEHSMRMRLMQAKLNMLNNGNESQ